MCVAKGGLRYAVTKTKEQKVKGQDSPHLPHIVLPATQINQKELRLHPDPFSLPWEMCAQTQHFMKKANGTCNQGGSQRVSQRVSTEERQPEKDWPPPPRTLTQQELPGDPSCFSLQLLYAPRTAPGVWPLDRLRSPCHRGTEARPS